jgi:hypothetical protein
MYKKTIAAVTLCSLAVTHAAPAWAQPQADDPEVPKVAAEPARVAPPVYTPPPGYVPYPVPPPAPLRYEMRPRYGLVAAGAAVLGGIYLTTVMTTSIWDNMGNCSSSTSRCNQHWPLYIPVVGPFVDAARLGGLGQQSLTGVMVLNGLGQLAGLSMLIAGATTKRRVAIAGHSAQITPVFSGTSVGLMGRF